MLFRTITSKHAHGTGAHPVTAELGHFATQEISHVHDKTDKVLRYVFGKRFSRAHQHSMRRRSKTAGRLWGARSVRFHYDKPSQPNSHSNVKNKQENGYGYSYGVDGGGNGSSGRGADIEEGQAQSRSHTHAHGQAEPGAEGESEGQVQDQGRRSREFMNRQKRSGGMKGGRGLKGENEESARVDAAKQV